MTVPAPNPDNWAVVTGASSGIGAALARELAARGYNTILIARRAQILQELAAELRAEHAVHTEVHALDLADRQQRERLCEKLADRQIAILCNNAGIASFGPLAALPPAAERAQLELNATAVHDLTLAVLPQMLASQGGGILISGSAAGNLPIPGNATYAASKAFANTFAESLRGELRGSGVHVTVLAPGPVRTHTPTPKEASLVDRMVPDRLWISAETTARLSLNALSHNRMRIVPGVTGKIMSVAGQYLPRAWTAPIAGAFYRRLASSG
ncbi:MAG: SDR family oxidoreductase [Mycobacterium sp.]|nr:SDR family oxidoreductase [Mycobacterium sp.]